MRGAEGGHIRGLRHRLLRANRLHQSLGAQRLLQASNITEGYFHEIVGSHQAGLITVQCICPLDGQGPFTENQPSVSLSTPGSLSTLTGSTRRLEAARRGERANLIVPL